jgi:hypothetical protein
MAAETGREKLFQGVLGVEKPKRHRPERGT